jgi:hypothetical protein
LILLVGTERQEALHSCVRWNDEQWSKTPDPGCAGMMPGFPEMSCPWVVPD